jgi:hypothetical protein
MWYPRSLGRGVAGTYVGKQTCHSFLGAISGATMGLLSEDYTKKDRKLSRSPSQPPHPEFHSHTPIYERQYHPPPKPDCHCHTPIHEPYYRRHEAPRHPSSYSAGMGSISGSGLGVFAGKYATDFMGKKS